jgi:hypothetical protein
MFLRLLYFLLVRKNDSSKNLFRLYSHCCFVYRSEFHFFLHLINESLEKEKKNSVGNKNKYFSGLSIHEKKPFSFSFHSLEPSW